MCHMTPSSCYKCHVYIPHFATRQIFPNSAKLRSNFSYYSFPQTFTEWIVEPEFSALCGLRHVVNTDTTFRHSCQTSLLIIILGLFWHTRGLGIRLLKTVAGIRFQDSSCKNSNGLSDNGKGIYLGTALSVCQIFHLCFRSIRLSYEGTDKVRTRRRR